MKKKDNESKQVGEPNVEYELSNKMVFFRSFEEENEHTHRTWASTSSIEHLQHVTSFMKKVFAEELKNKPQKSNRIIFD